MEHQSTGFEPFDEALASIENNIHRAHLIAYVKEGLEREREKERIIGIYAGGRPDRSEVLKVHFITPDIQIVEREPSPKRERFFLPIINGRTAMCGAQDLETCILVALDMKYNGTNAQGGVYAARMLGLPGAREE
jgi:hypothetical protein